MMKNSNGSNALSLYSLTRRWSQISSFLYKVAFVVSVVVFALFPAKLWILLCVHCAFYPFMLHYIFISTLFQFFSEFWFSLLFFISYLFSFSLLF